MHWKLEDQLRDTTATDRPRSHGITVNLVPVPAVLPWSWSPSPRCYRQLCPHYRGVTAVTAGKPWSPSPWSPSLPPTAWHRTDSLPPRPIVGSYRIRLKPNFRQFACTERQCVEHCNTQHNKCISLPATSILVISNRNSFRVPFDKIASVYFIWKLYLNWKWPSHGTSTVPVVLAHFRSLCRGCWGCFTSSSEKRIQKDIQWEDTKTEDHGTKGPCILELQTMFSRDCFYLERFF